MKIAKKECLTGMGRRSFILVIPETIEEGVQLGQEFLESDDMGNSIFYPMDDYGIAASIDPERLVEFLNDNLFMGELADKDAGDLIEAILNCFPDAEEKEE